MSPFSKQKHSATLGGMPEDDPETATLNRFVLAIGRMDSIILKPASRFICRPTQLFTNRARSATIRQAIALAATASANGIVLSAGVRLPRTVSIDGVAGFVENGVSCAIATSLMARVLLSSNPKHEVYELNADQVRMVVGLIGLKKGFELGIADINSLGTVSP